MSNPGEDQQAPSQPSTPAYDPKLAVPGPCVLHAPVTSRTVTTSMRRLRGMFMRRGMRGFGSVR